MNATLRLRLLRIALVFSAFVWGISIVGVFLSWDTATAALEGMGAKRIEYDRMLDYWLRMASGAFALVGTGYLIAAINPRKYAICLPWLAGVMICEGFILLGHGLRLGLGPFPFLGDISACFAGGCCIFFLRNSADSQGS